MHPDGYPIILPHIMPNDTPVELYRRMRLLGEGSYGKAFLVE